MTYRLLSYAGPNGPRGGLTVTVSLPYREDWADLADIEATPLAAESVESPQLSG